MRVGSSSAPGPGKPATWFTDWLAVGGMQNVAATTAVCVPGVPWRTIVSRKHCRRPALQVWPLAHEAQFPTGGGLQSSSWMHPRKISMLQLLSMGPASQTPSSGPSVGFGEHTVSMHAFGAVGWPGRLQKPLGHCDAAVQTAPAFGPPMQRRPPHAIPAGQSALLLQGSAAAVAQVSQKQLPPFPLVHGRFFASWVVPVVAGSKAIASTPMPVADEGGQSRLSSPKNGLEPPTSQL
jgi:hypothetical protein